MGPGYKRLSSPATSELLFLLLLVMFVLVMVLLLLVEVEIVTAAWS